VIQTGLCSFVAAFFMVVLAASSASAQALPTGWATQDVGAVAAVGAATAVNNVFTVAGSGSDVWGTADEFRFVYQPLTGDGSIVTKVSAIDTVNAWVKAGVMMRESLDANARHAFMLVSPGRGLAFQRRTSTGGASASTAGGSGTSPYYVKLTRSGTTFTAEKSADGASWTTVGTASISMTSTIYVGLAVSSHVDGIRATATFESTTLNGLPPGWSTQDIGAVGVSGAATLAHGLFSVTGAGADVWGTADAFRFAYTTLAGDGSIVSRVAAIDNVNGWVKAGVMMRDSLAAHAAHAFMLVSPGKGLAFQRRAATGRASTHTSAGAGAAPAYVKLTRAGQTITAATSADGQHWTTVGQHSIAMGATIYVGLAVSSHDTRQRASATFAATNVMPEVAAAPTPRPPTPVGPAPVPPEPVRPEPPSPEADAKDTGATDEADLLGPSTLRVLHWNLYHGQDANKKYALARQMEVIAAAKADVISLNEVEKLNASYGNVDQAAAIATYLTAKTGTTWYPYMVVGSGASKGIGNAIISRFPLHGTSVCQLSRSRNAVQASMTIHGRTVNLWSTHLAVESGRDRVDEVNALQACMSNYAEQRVVAGDFNASTSTTELKDMIAGHTDGWAQAKSLGVTVNYSGNCDGCTRNSRIDYLFISKQATALVLTKAEIIDTRNAKGVMASDHKPLVVTFDVK
jgi:endonuclease/exonuclease/phosphatase family metal-dependent hydrolase/regulation of enolase protein 1 (concanavalin A-like superfamily)